MKNDLPAARGTSGNVLGPIIQVKDFRALTIGPLFHYLVKPRIGLHGAMLIRQNVVVEVAEEWKAVANMADRKVIRIGKDIGRYATGAQFGLQRHHRVDGHEDIAEKPTEFFQFPAETGHGTNLIEKLLLGHQSGFISEQQRRMINKTLHFLRQHLPTRGDSASGDAVIKIKQHLA